MVNEQDERQGHDTLSVGLVQMGSSTERPENNLGKACDLIDRALDNCSIDLAVLPEFFSTGYFPQSSDVARYWGCAETENGRTLSVMREMARKHHIHVVVPIYEEERPGVHYDTAVLIGEHGDIVGKYRKTHCPAVDGGYEKLYYTPGSEFPVFEILGWQLGIAICYDWRFPESVRSLAAKGAELVVMPFATPKMTMWEQALRTRAWENQIYLGACNMVGRDGNWVFSGSSLLADPYGELVVLGNDRNEQVLVGRADKSRLRQARQDDFNWRDRRPEIYASLTQFSDQL